MPIGIQTRGSLGDIGTRGLGPQFEDVFDQNLIKFEGMDNVKRIISFVPTDKGVLRTTGVTGYSFLEEFTEGKALPKDRNQLTFETVYSIRDLGKSITVTDNEAEDKERLGEKLDEMAGLTRMANITRARAAMQIFNGAFVTTAKVNGISLHRYNDERLCSTVHARADGGSTQSNASATGITLTELNIETQRLLLVKQLSDIGLPIVDMGKITAVVPDDLEKDAVIFTQSQLRASTANNDLNFYFGRIDVIVSRWLTAPNGGSATAWFLTTSNPMPEGNVLRVYERGGPRFKETFEGETWNKVFGVKDRYAVGHSEWKGLVGSLGDGASFSS